MDVIVLNAAKALAASRGHACKGDIDLICFTLQTLKAPRVVQLGAGSGTMALAVFGANPDAALLTVDIDAQALAWEKKALDNMLVKLDSYEPLLSDSAAAGEAYAGAPVDLLIVDTDHEKATVLAELRAWEKHAQRWILLHDFDGATAPVQYPGVAEAAREFFGRDPDMRQGWSAVWYVKRHVLWAK